MRRKYVIISIVILIILFLIVFRNIVYAFICCSEKIDRNMFGVMVQGAIAPSKEFVLDGNGRAITIGLPGGTGEIDRSTFLIPRANYMEYLMSLEDIDGYTVENHGSSIAVEFEGESIFHISVTPYTGAYMKLKFSR